MASSGTVTVDFAAETAKFTAELKKVRADLRGLKDETASIGKQLGAVGKTLLGVFSAGAVIAGIRAVVRATAEEEAAVAQLESALKTAGAQVGLTSKDLTAFASELQKTTTFADDAIISAQSLLLSFKGLSGDVVKGATRAVLDLSSRLGTDLNSAARLVGRALADPEKGLTALSRAGVTFSEAQKDIIKSFVDVGDTAQAQALILRELEARFGGAAVAARNTLGGAIAGLKNAFGDLLESKDGMPAATLAINKFADTLNSPGVKAGFDVLVSALARVVELTAKAATGVANVAAETGSLLSSALVPGSQFTAIQALRIELRDLEARQKALANSSEGQLDPGKQKLAELAAYNATLRERIALLEEAGKVQQRTIEKPAASGLTIDDLQPVSVSVSKLSTDFLDNRLLDSERFAAALKIEAENFAQIEREMLESRSQAIQEAINRDLAAYLDYNAQRISQEQQLSEQTIELRQGVANAAIGLLQFLASKSKTAAIALILVSRGLAIAQTIQSTAAAVMKAFQIYGPTPQGFALAATMKTLGAIQVGLIAATGALEVGQVLSGNSAAAVGPGTPNNPVRVEEVGTIQDRAAGAEQRKQINVTFEGLFTGAAAREIAISLREVIDNADVHIIGPNSSQATEIRGG